MLIAAVAKRPLVSDMNTVNICLMSLWARSLILGHIELKKFKLLGKKIGCQPVIDKA